MYCVHLYTRAKQRALHFAHVLFAFYALLSEQNPDRPDDLNDKRPWDQEIRLKKTSKWLMSLGEQCDEATDNTQTGDEQVVFHLIIPLHR